MWYIVEENTDSNGFTHDIIAARTDKAIADKMVTELMAARGHPSLSFEVWSEEKWLTHEVLWVANIINQHKEISKE